MKDTFKKFARLAVGRGSHVMARLRNGKVTQSKVFGIGYNKTGTTSLAKILTGLWLRMPNQGIQERHLTDAYYRGDYQAFLKFVPYYDAFQDMPFSQESTYVALDALFPNSRFILTVREPEAWYDSMVRFYQVRTGVEDIWSLSASELDHRFNYLKTGYVTRTQKRLVSDFVNGESVIRWEKFLDRDRYIDEYVRRNYEVQRYFMDAPGKLLVVDLTRVQTTQSVCDFLGFAEAHVTLVPWENKT